MRDTVAYAIAAELKRLGHKVRTVSAPKGRSPMPDAETDDLAVVGDGSLTPEAVEECVNAARKRLAREWDGYVLCPKPCRQYPNTAFAAW